MARSAGFGLSDVSATMLLTLYCHVRAQQARHPLLTDPESVRLWNALLPMIRDSADPRMARLVSDRIPDLGVRYVALRARHFDAIVREFLARTPRGQVVSMGCGLDPRFSRVDNGCMHFVDVDLPPVITLKSRFFSETERYRMRAASVTEPAFLDTLGLAPGEPVLFLAEGLFMYLDERDVAALVRGIRDRFPGAELAFEVINRRWLDPRLYWIVRHKLRHRFGLGPEANFHFGLRSGHELEAWMPGISLIGEWSFLDEPWQDVGGAKVLAWVNAFRKSQWVLHYRLGS